MNKSELRKLYLEKRLAFSPSEIAVASSRIAERFFNETDLAKIEKLHTYIRIARLNEIDTSSIYYRIWYEHRSISTYAPRADHLTGEMENMAFGPDTELIENKWGIREPLGTETAGPSEIDLVIVPLLCFDESGHRVGYGKGFYDRFLALCRHDCINVGLSLFPPVSGIADVYENDIPLDYCITPERNYLFRDENGCIDH